MSIEEFVKLWDEYVEKLSLEHESDASFSYFFTGADDFKDYLVEKLFGEEALSEFDRLWVKSKRLEKQKNE